MIRAIFGDMRTNITRISTQSHRDHTATLDLSDLGLGVRCRRFAAVLDDGVFRHVAVEPGRGITVCGAEHLLERLDRAPY